MTSTSHTTDSGFLMYARTERNTDLPTPEARIQQQAALYWRARIQSKLDQLEREARRMFQLEEDLSRFANQYYDAVGEVTARLTQVEERLAAEQSAPPTAAAAQEPVMDTLPEVLAQRDASVSRRSEIKARYRSLAKEIHPDRTMMVEGGGNLAAAMHALNAAYEHGDLAGLLKLEAQLALSPLMDTAQQPTGELENALREIERAADTYAQGYRSLLNSPLNELMLRAMSARLAGWDWMETVVRKVERSIELKERALIEANIAAIGEWRENVQQQAV